MQGPVRRIRDELGLSRSQLAQLTAMRLDAIYLAENGLIDRPQQKLLEALEELGYSPCQVTSEFRAYRDELKQKVLAALGDAQAEQRDGAALDAGVPTATQPISVPRRARGGPGGPGQTVWRLPPGPGQ